jgi:hypothetical protein
MIYLGKIKNGIIRIRLTWVLKLSNQANGKSITFVIAKWTGLGFYFSHKTEKNI